MMPPWTSRERFLLVVCAAVVFVFVMWRWVALPLGAAHSTWQREIVTLQRKLVKEKKIVNLGKASLSRLKQYKDVFAQQGSGEEAVSRMIAMVESAAAKAGVKIIELKPVPLRRRDGVNMFVVGLVFNESFLKAMVFLDALQSAPYFFAIDEMDMSALTGMNMSGLRVSVSLSRLTIPEGR